MTTEPITTNNVLQIVITGLLIIIVYIIYHYQKQREIYKIAYLQMKKRERRKYKEISSELFISVEDYKKASDDQILTQLSQVVADDIKRTKNLRVESDFSQIQSGKIRLVLNHNVHVN